MKEYSYLMGKTKNLFISKDYIVSSKNIVEKNLDGALIESILLHAVSRQKGVTVIMRMYKDKGQGYVRIHLSIDLSKNKIQQETLDELEKIGFNIIGDENIVNASGFFNVDDAINVMEKIAEIV